MTNNRSKIIYVDPSYKAYYEDRLFDQTDPVLNRDDTLAPFIRLRAALEQQGVAFVSLSEAIDTRSASGRLLFHVMGALAEFERSLIAERTRAGIAAARGRGRSIGRPLKLSLDQVKAAFAQLASGRVRLKDLADQFGVSPLTLTRAFCRLP